MTSDDQLESRLQRLLTSQADQLGQPEPRLTGPILRARSERTPRRFVTPVLAAAAVLALFLLPVLLSRHDGPGSRVTPGGPVSSVVVPAPPRHSPTVHRPATPSASVPTPSVATLVAPTESPSVQTPTATSPPIPSYGISAVPAPTSTG